VADYPDGPLQLIHPFKTRHPPGGLDAPRHIEHLFSEEDTSKIIRLTKSNGLTINHLGVYIASSSR
jgi:hypothetical protein